jgi:hypothetical protein
VRFGFIVPLRVLWLIIISVLNQLSFQFPKNCPLIKIVCFFKLNLQKLMILQRTAIGQRM